jgi:hypothetical protein
MTKGKQVTSDKPSLTPKTAIYQTQSLKPGELTPAQAERISSILSSDIGERQKYILLEEYFLKGIADKLDSLCVELKEQSYMKEYISGVRHARFSIMNHLSQSHLVRVLGEDDLETEQD